MKKRKNKKLTLSKETLAPLDAQALGGAAAAVGCPQESNRICSIQHTCVSCAFTTATNTCQ